MIKYTFNQHIFDAIDTAEKAYWIGFLYADGGIASTGSNVYVALKENDIKQLQNFEIFLNFTPDGIKHDESFKSVRLTVSRIPFHDALSKLGFTPTKSYDTTLNVWDNIPDTYKKDFILGLWDGDGSFSFSGEGQNLASLISNNDALIHTIADYINTQIEKDFCKVKERTPGDPYPRIRFKTNKAKIFGDWLYKNIQYPVLDRKYQNYLKMEIHEKAHHGFDNKLTKGILCIESNTKYITAKECCRVEFGIDNPGAINSIRCVCRGERPQTRGKHFRYLTEEERKEFINELNNKDESQ